MPKPPTGAYREALTKARGIAARITEERGNRILSAVQAYGLGIQRAMSGDALQGVSQSEALSRSYQIIAGQAGRLQGELWQATAEGRSTAFTSILHQWRKTQRLILEDLGTDLHALGGLRAADISLVNAFDAIGAAQNWRTLIQAHVANAAEEANQIVRLGMAEGVTADELGRRLRKYVTGSEDFQGAFQGIETATGRVAKIDLRQVPGGTRGAAREMVHNANRIAFSEIQNARSEAELQHFIQDPLTEAARWVLSPNRGISFDPPDECDVMADADFYGMGGGVYPLTQFPGPPHPWDRCEREPVTRDLKNAKDPKPLQVERKRSASQVQVPQSHRLSEARIGRIQANVDRALVQGETAMRGLADAVKTGTPIRVLNGVLQETAAKAAGQEALARSAEDIANELTEVRSKAEGVRQRVAARKEAIEKKLEEVRARSGIEKAKALKDDLSNRVDAAWKRKEDTAKRVLDLNWEIGKTERQIQVIRERGGSQEAIDNLTEFLQKKRVALEKATEEANAAQESYRSISERLTEARKAYGEAIRDPEYERLAQQKSALRKHEFQVNRAERNEMRKVMKRPPERRNTVKVMHRLRKNRKQIEEGIEGFRDLVDKKYLDGLTLEGKPASSSRAFYRNGNKSVNFHPDRRSPDTIIHEIAHAIEYEHPEVASATADFFSERTAGEALQKLQDLQPGFGYRSYEVAKPDDFYNPYVGRVYKGGPATEIVTMGLERMWRDPLDFWEEDPGHFTFTWKIMTGAF